MFEKVKDIEQRYNELSELLSDQEVLKNLSLLQQYAKEHSSLSPIVEAYGRLQIVQKEIQENQELCKEDDAELRELAEQELTGLTLEKEELEKHLHEMLVPKDPFDEKNIFLEIRAGTGGDEAGLFAADLFRMYAKYAEGKGWKVDIVSQNATGIGGLKEIIALVEGKNVYSRLKYESGVHRVQRVPSTESQGRIHTSAVTVAILPEADDVEIEINANDLRIDVFRSSGPGGQSVNTTDSAVRITHVPTGVVVTCQDEKSQHKNKAKAMRVLKARILDRLQEEQQREIAEKRKEQVRTGDRSERIRTYNFPQGRVTDHRVGLTIHRLEGILEGEMDDIFDALQTSFQEAARDAL